MTALKQRHGLSQIKSFSGVAILLAAGVGRRLGEDHQGPKVLLSFAGRSLLRRSLEALFAYGVRHLTITVGYEADTIRSAVAAILSNDLKGLEIEFIDNPDYRDGSLVSLHCQAQALRAGQDILLLDGDVLYDHAMIDRLLRSTSEGVLLVDREIEPGDEPVKICFDDAGRIVDFRKVPTHPHIWFGESVGFFRFSGRLAAALADRCGWYVSQGLMKTEYEEAIRDLILADPGRFGAEDVSDLAWTEIDFPEDVVKARDIVLPQLES